MNEIWKDIKGYEGLYQVSNLGRVKSLNYRGTGQEKMLEGESTANGYLAVCLCNGNTQKTLRVHRLVAQAFIENPDNKPCIDHINTVRTDNRVDNLRWVTHKENYNNPITKKRHLGKRNYVKKVFCENIIYDSLAQCAKHYNVRNSTMSRWLTGHRTMPTDFQEKGLRYYIEE